MKVFLDVPRPDEVNLSRQGRRGPFHPILVLLRAQADIDEWMMRQKKYPWLYEAGVRYAPEPMQGPKMLYMTRGRGKERGEHFKNIEELIRDGEGDCDDIAPARAAELRVKCGIHAVPCIKWRRYWISDRWDLTSLELRAAGHSVMVDGDLLRSLGHRKPFWMVMVHVLVMWPDGRIEDPCRVLGMRGEYE